MTILYCDCFSGISGDMFLGALLDAGLPIDHLADQFKRLNLPEFKGVSVERVYKGALAATQLKLDIPEYNKGADQDIGDNHRHLNEVQTIIETSDLSEVVKEISLKIFSRLAEAEAKVHGCPVEEVHFHEVGAVDSMLDIVGAVIGLQFFNVRSIYASALPLGTGQIPTQHGMLPLPAPATLELLVSVQAPIVSSPAKAELVTPTGAAILAELATFAQPDMRLQRVGVGAGRRNFEWPNVLRVLIGEEESRFGNHLEIETNIDDMNPQVLGHVMTKLFQAGALDVYFTPIYMKKNRPSTKLSVIARREDELTICDLILRESSTLGLRVTPVWRHEAQREMRNIPTRYGDVPVKLKILDGNVIQATPEFDACLLLAETLGIPVNQILQEATVASRTFLNIY